MRKLPRQVRLVQESKIPQKKKNKHVSYSQLSVFNECQRKWELTYLRKLAPYRPSIHATFGTAFHETIQDWLDVMYNDSVKKANEMPLGDMLAENMVKAYKGGRAQNGHEDYSDPKEMEEFLRDGVNIIEYIQKKRTAFFTTKRRYLAGVETLLYQELSPGVMFKGFIDLVFYDEKNDMWTIVDIKTSTRGWNPSQKKDDGKVAQIMLYKEFFSKQFDIPLEKIRVEYFIVKRRIPINAEFTAALSRVQQYGEPDTFLSRPVRRKNALDILETFREVALDGSDYVDKQYPTKPSKDACKWCDFKKMRICPDAQL